MIDGYLSGCFLFAALWGLGLVWKVRWIFAGCGLSCLRGFTSTLVVVLFDMVL